jgi:hypothetical protein
MIKTARVIEVDSVSDLMKRYNYAKRGDIYVVCGRAQNHFDRRKFYEELRILEMFFTLYYYDCDIRPSLMFKKYEKYKKVYRR